MSAVAAANVIANRISHVPLAKAAEVVMGQSPPGQAYNTSGDGLPLLTGPETYGPRHPVVTKWTSTVTKVCEPNDILFCVRGNTLGRLNIADQRMCIGRGVAAIRGRNRVAHTAYLFYVMHLCGPAMLRAAIGNGSTFPNISKAELEQWPIPLPPLDEQRRIARILSGIQRAIGVERDAVVNIRRLRSSMFDHLFSGAEAWERAPIGAIARTSSGGTPRRDNSSHYGGSIPWVKSGEVADCLIDSTEEHITESALRESAARLIPAGTLLMAMYGATAGQVAELGLDAATNQAVCAITPNDGVFSRYLYYALQRARRELKDARFGGAQPNLSQQTIRQFAVPIPDTTVQSQIIRALRAVDNAVDGRLTTLKSLDLLFRSTLYALLGTT